MSSGGSSKFDVQFISRMVVSLISCDFLNASCILPDGKDLLFAIHSNFA